MYACFGCARLEAIQVQPVVVCWFMSGISRSGISRSRGSSSGGKWNHSQGLFDIGSAKEGEEYSIEGERNVNRRPWKAILKQLEVAERTEAMNSEKSRDEP